MRIGRCLLAGTVCGAVAGVGAILAFAVANFLTVPAITSLPHAISTALALSPICALLGAVFGFAAVTPYLMLREWKQLGLRQDVLAIGVLSLLLVALLGEPLLFDSDTMRERAFAAYLRLWLSVWLGSCLGLMPLPYLLPRPTRVKSAF